MSSRSFVSNTFVCMAVALSLAACDEEKSTSAAKPAVSAAPAQPASAPEPKASAPVASAEPAGPHHDCPEGSTGDGTFSKPCDAKETARLVEVTWTGKIDDKGPYFRVVSKSKLDVLYGKVFIYFYDKGGKQLQVKDASETPPKDRPNASCGGNIFDGPLKAGEKAVITFSCVKKDTVPEGTTAIEAEMQMVGFADESGKKSEYFWRNKDLTPDTRPMSKAKGKK